MKKSLLSLSLALVAASVVSFASAQDKVTITVGVFPDHDAIFKAALPGFNKKFPNIEVKINSLAYPDHHNALTTALATGAGANDMEVIDFGYVAKFAEGGGLVDLAKAPYNALQLRSKFVSYTFPQGMTDDGRMIALPTDIGPGSMFYRTDLLQKAGVNPADLTKSWASYIEAGKKIVAANPGTFMIPDAHEVANIIIRTGLGAGEGLYFDKNNKVLFSNKTIRFVKAFTVAKQIRDAGLDAKAGGAFSGDWTTAFQKGNLATEVSGAWLVGHMQNWLAKDYAGKWAAQQLPGRSFTSYGGSFYGIPTQSKHKGEAWELIKYMSTDADQQILAFKTSGAFPALRAAQSAPLFNEGVPYLADQKARLLWRTAANNIRPIEVNRLDSVADQIFNDAITSVLDGTKTVNQALNEATALLARRVK